MATFSGRAIIVRLGGQIECLYSCTPAKLVSMLSDEVARVFYSLLVTRCFMSALGLKFRALVACVSPLPVVVTDGVLVVSNKPGLVAVTHPASKFVPCGRSA